MLIFYFSNLLSVAIFGFALLMMLRLWRQGSREDASIFYVTLRIFAWTLMIVGSLGWLVGVSTILAAILIPGAIVLMLTTYARYRQGETRLIVSALSRAIDYQIPLSEAAYSFATEHTGETGYRARNLSRLLESGIDFLTAMRQAKIHLPKETQMAYQLGQEFGQSSSLLNEMNQVNSRWSSSMRIASDRLFTVILVGLPSLAIMTFIYTFVMLRLIPTFKEIFDDFELELPAMTQLLIAAGTTVFTNLPLMLVFYTWMLLINPVLMALFLIFLLNYIGWIDYYPWGMRWLKGPEDQCKVLILLSLGVKRDFSLDAMLKSIGNSYLSRGLSKRIQRAVQWMEQGEDWVTALHKIRLLNQAERGILTAAQQAGNLSWALQEVAESKMRRHSLRVVPAINGLIPMVILLIGFQVAFIVIGLFLPLVDLIQNLS